MEIVLTAAHVSVLECVREAAGFVRSTGSASGALEMEAEMERRVGEPGYAEARASLAADEAGSFASEQELFELVMRQLPVLCDLRQPRGGRPYASRGNDELVVASPVTR